MDIKTKRKQKKQDEAFTKCECRRLGQNCDEDCINALDYRSCTMSNCSWGCSMKCQNRNMIHQHPELVLFSTTDKGIGVTCKKDIKRGEYVASYLGELFHKDDSDWKEQKAKYSKRDCESYKL